MPVHPPIKHADRLPASARQQKAVRYIGASGYRRFSAEKRNADRSLAAETWLAIVAAIMGSLILLGVLQESRSAQKEKPAASASAASAPAPSR